MGEKIKRLHPIKHAHIIEQVRALWRNRAVRPIRINQIAKMFGLSRFSVGGIVHHRNFAGFNRERGNYDILMLDKDTPAYPSDADQEADARRRFVERADALFTRALRGRRFEDRVAA